MDLGDIVTAKERKNLHTIVVAGEALADTLRELVYQDDRWGYWAAHKALQDEYRNRVRLALIEWDHLKGRNFAP